MPGILDFLNPTKTNPQQQAQASPMDKFLGNPMLLNILAQQGHSLTPGPSPLGVIGRAGLATNQQNQADRMSSLNEELLKSRIGLNKARAENPITNQAKPPASIAEYNLYSEQTKAAGKEPMSFEDYKTRFGGSQFITLADGTVVQAPRSFGGQGPQEVVSPDQAADASTRSAINAATSSEQASATTDIPDKKLTLDRALRDLDRLRNHPGLSAAQGVKGASSGFGALNSPIAGTSAADFAALREQASGGAFLEAYQQLKGGGPITDREGEAALAAITIMGNPDISEAAFLEALDDYEEAIKAGYKKLEKAAEGDFSPQPSATPDFSTMSDDELKKYIQDNSK